MKALTKKVYFIIIQDAKQSAMQTNILAKLLVKFINQTNQCSFMTYLDYRDSLRDVRKQKKDKEKKPEIQPNKAPQKQ